MAGIGFSLRKMMKEDNSYGTQVRAWFHTSIVAAGPWVISILTINFLMIFSRKWEIAYAERELLIAAVIYSTLFSQILTAPFQMLITRYIADRIYTSEYEYIKPSFWGLSLMMLVLSFGLAILFYRGCGLPDEFVYIASALFILLTILWILNVYLSTMKNFKLITFSNLLGSVITFLVILFFADNPIPFSEMQGATNLLLSYLVGMFVTLLFLLVVLMSELGEDNGKVFHFIRYFHAVPSLWPIGLLYTASLWVDNIIMWFSPISLDLYGVYRYAPFYDVASFYAYLSILPSIMMFMVLIETDFYVKCREFYLAIIENAPLKELESFAKRMRDSLFQDVVRTFELQLFVTLLIIALSSTIFPLLNVPEATRKIFVIYSLGAMCNSFILIFLQVLLYIGERNRAMFLMGLFFFSNFVLTLISMNMGENFYGAGFFVSSFITMIVGAFISYYSYHRVIQHTFMTQPVFTRVKQK
ncbi:MAG: exopolysaccharide Pel transporter PelG, partial [Candidatus Brocadiales bacterium]|nr:exopolysaccharide Pel transporter PelG [Candidatus Brocadiales bacterium]